MQISKKGIEYVCLRMAVSWELKGVAVACRCQSKPSFFWFRPPIRGGDDGPRKICLFFQLTDESSATAGRISEMVEVGTYRTLLASLASKVLHLNVRPEGHLEGMKMVEERM